MSHEEQSLLRTIIDSPGDSVPRMIYADWLEEQGRSSEAEQQRNFPLRYVRSIRVPDIEILMSRHVDEAQRARDICRRDAFLEPIDASCEPVACRNILLNNMAITDTSGIIRGVHRTATFYVRDINADQMRRLTYDSRLWFIPNVGMAAISSVEGTHFSNRSEAYVRATVIQPDPADPRTDFLQPIIENPSDPSLRMVYADWLEEHGFAEEAANHRRRAFMA